MVFDFDERKDISTTLVSVETLSMTSITTYMLVGNLPRLIFNRNDTTDSIMTQTCSTRASTMLCKPIVTVIKGRRKFIQ